MAIREAMTKYGKMIGAPSNYSFVSVFRGIPFAKPPVGERRWKAPEPLDVPADPEAVAPRLCHTFAKMSTQLVFPLDASPNVEGYSYPEPMSEDSLYLNIWTPAESPDEKLPVMMWIHGGAYMGGHSYSSTINGEIMGKQGVVLVTVAYRLGGFGFFAHPQLSAESPDGVSGNYGTLDQMAALRWVHENIAGFGGDPDNITVFGQSAGAHSAQVLASSPLSRHMVNRIILESGASMNNCELLPMRTLEEAEEYGVKILDAIGAGSIAEARTLDEATLLERMVKADFELSGPDILAGLHFSPVIDGHVIEERLGDTAIEGRIADIDIMMGHTDEGGLEFPLPLDAYPAWLETFGADADKLAQLLNVSTQEQLDAVNPAGFRGKLITATAALAEARCATGNHASYCYYFARPLPGDDQGATHSAELFYVFNCLNNNWRPYCGTDYEIANTLNAYWTNFAKTGDPNGAGLPRWQPYETAAPARLRIGDGIESEALHMPAWQRFLVDYAKSHS